MGRTAKGQRYVTWMASASCGLCLLMCGSSDPITDPQTTPIRADAGTKSSDGGTLSPGDAQTIDSSTTQTLPPFGPEWQLAGNATLQGNTVNLAPNATSQAGAIFYKTPLDAFRTLEATFSFRVEKGDAKVFAPGDGLTLAWVSASAPPGVGGGGGALGFCGLTGGATAFDIFQNNLASEGPVPSIEVLEAPNKTTCVVGEHTLTSIPEITDGTFHAAHVTWDRAASTIVVAIDSVVELAVNVNQNVTGALYVGFTAATGDGTARFDVENATIVVDSCL